MITRKRRQGGFTMLEVVIAVSLLAIGLLACSSLVVVGMASNTRNQNDSGGTLMAQMVIEQINTISANSGNNIALTDCAGGPWTINTAAATGNGAGANLDPNNGYDIDFIQLPTAIPAGYHMSYVMCASSQARQATYDVRWNIKVLTPGTNLVTVSARQTALANGNPVIYSQPVTLRTIQGQ